MGFTYTKEQQNVIDARDCSLLVSAAAGSGKTAVLVERIVNMVSDEKAPVDIDRLLIVTFTNAAASEMRERISDALGKKLEGEPDNGHLQRQITLLHNAQITTIDSFCLFLIRNNFNDIGLDPGFRVMDEGELKLLRGEVMTELMESQYLEGDRAFTDCLESFHQSGDEKGLMEHIGRLYDFARSYPFPEKWLLWAKETYMPSDLSEVEKTQWMAFVREDTEKTIASVILCLEDAIKLCEEPDGPYMYIPILEEEKEMLRSCMSGESFEDNRQAFAGLAFGRLPSKRDSSVSSEKREMVKGIRTRVKESLEKMAKRYYFESEESIFADIAGSGDVINTLITLTLQFGKLLAEKKREKKVLDFGDMEHFALQILLEEQEGTYVPSRAAREYAGYFHEIMVDEYQDSNLVQEYILESISGKEEKRYNRFMVGDVKQSIYKFRLARPEIFMKKYDQYTQEGKERKIVLSRNFRSRKEVTDRVNHVFSRIMRKELGGIAYDEEAALFPGADYPNYENAEAELLLLSREKGSEASRAEQEAALIAGRICRLMEEHMVTDAESGQLRPVRYGDIAILFRAGAGWDETLQSVLKSYGIPAHTASSTGYFTSEEIRTMLHFLRILDNPLQDIPMFGVMHSILGGFTDSEIARIHAAFPGRKLYEALQQMAEAENVSKTEYENEEKETDKRRLRGKAAGFLEVINRYREKTAWEPVKQILREIMAETGYMQYILAFPEGNGRKANLDMLLLKAANFEKTGSHGLFAFIRYMEQLEQYDVDYGEAGVVDEHADVVRIMSIHKSKGLEFPVCIVSGLAKRFNIQDQTKSLLMDVDLGLGGEFTDLERRIRRSTLRRNVLARKQHLDNLGEELRILYVAMTRAREKLILTGCMEEPEKKLASLGLQETEAGWMGQSRELSFLALSAAGSFLDFLLPVWKGTRVVNESDLRKQDVVTAVKDSWRRQRLEEYEKEESVSTWEEAFAERFSYVYPRNLSGLYTKTTVSELKQERMTETSEGAAPLFEKEKEPYIPRFCSMEKKMSGAARGSAFHRLMELFDFTAFLTIKTKEDMTQIVNDSIERFHAAGKLSELEYNCIDRDKIVKFLMTETAARMGRAAENGLLRKEQPFMLGLSADRVRPEFPAEETVLIQGIIDVYWEENGKLVVLDYKTDRTSQIEELADRYRVQLDYYGEALTRITSKAVKEKLIYSFYFDTILELDKSGLQEQPIPSPP